MSSSDENVVNTELSEEDHRRFFEVGPGTLLVLFLVVFSIVTSFFYWFKYNMASNANKKVQQAKTILERAEEVPEQINPLTLELETMVHETEQERNWILDELTADSFAERFDKKLKNRYLNETARLRLPPNWKDNLPRKLRQWANNRRRQRRTDVNQFLNRLDSTLDEITQRIKRVEAIREEKSIKPGRFGGSVERYLTVKSNVLSRIETLKSDLNNAKAKFDLPRSVFDGALKLVDPMTKLALHFRGFSALTAAPASYYHAERLLNDALRIDPKNPAAYYYLGEIYRKLKLGAVASEHKIRALKWDPSYKRDAILETFRQRLEEDPSDPRRRYDLAWALYEVGDRQEAKKHLKRILREQQGKDTMVRVLARKRLRYLLNGEPPYNKLTHF